MRYRTHALILAAFAVTLGGLAAQTQKKRRREGRSGRGAHRSHLCA